MLYVVQVVLSGRAKIPKVFLNEAQAEAAFVRDVKRCWARSYGAYCERHGVDGDEFSAARGFVDGGLDLADASRIHYWAVTPEDGAVQPAQEPPAPAPAESAVQEEAPADAEKYTTKEWTDYVESIKGMCGGNRSEYHLFTRADWRQAVYSNATGFEYWQWVAVRIDEVIEKAQKAGYTVVDDPQCPGHYRFKTPDGVMNDISCAAEGEAWCRAGLDAEG